MSNENNTQKNNNTAEQNLNLNLNVNDLLAALELIQLAANEGAYKGIDLITKVAILNQRFIVALSPTAEFQKYIEEKNKTENTQNKKESSSKKKA